MLQLLWFIPALPFAGFLLLMAFGSRLSHRATAAIGVGSIGLSALVTFLVAYSFLSSPPEGHVYTQTLWLWFDVGGLSAGIAFHLDALSLIMMLVVTGVGFLIHLYSSEFMIDDEAYARFFSYMNLFVGSMLTLVMADNLLLLLLGWEGVGLCSYLLIGFWYTNPANGYAARKAFVVTRVGDTALLIGLFLLFSNFGTLNIAQILHLAPDVWSVGSGIAVATALLLLGGAVGKSGQLPLQTWLPDAMAGPTPVSALIHAATMVTAGVYLIARTHVIFELAPFAMHVVAMVGAATLLIAGFSALAQSDIKRVLAYSTISQIGYMFLALGVGAWSAAMFHFMTHAFFKALLFLAAGVVIMSLHHEHNMFKMGGLREKLPVAFWTFLIGAASLAALPLVTAGFYSKELILWHAWNWEAGGRWFWGIGILGAFVTAVYTFRMVFLTFFGEAKTELSHHPGRRMGFVLIALAVLSTIGGFLETPHTLGHVTIFSNFMQTALPAGVEIEASMMLELFLQLVATVIVLGGVYLAYRLYVQRPETVDVLVGTPAGSAVRRFFFSGWGFDWLYDKLFVNPFLWLARINKNDVTDAFFNALPHGAAAAHYVLTRTQTGRLRWYAMGIAAGAVIVIALMVFA